MGSHSGKHGLQWPYASLGPIIAISENFVPCASPAQDGCEEQTSTAPALRCDGGSWPGRGARTTTSAPPPALTHGNQSWHSCTYMGCNHPLEKQEGRHNNTSSALSYMTRARLLCCSMLTDGQFANFSNSGKMQNFTDSRKTVILCSLYCFTSCRYGETLHVSTTVS